jgi:hypothetical protein
MLLFDHVFNCIKKILWVPSWQPLCDFTVEYINHKGALRISLRRTKGVLKEILK